MAENEPDHWKGEIRAAQLLKWSLRTHSSAEDTFQWKSMPQAVRRAIEGHPALIEAPPMNAAAQRRMLKTLEVIPPKFWVAVRAAFVARGWSRRDTSHVVGEPVPGEEGAAARALADVLLEAGRRPNALTPTQRGDVVKHIDIPLEKLRWALHSRTGVNEATGESLGLETPSVVECLEKTLELTLGHKLRLEVRPVDESTSYDYRDEPVHIDQFARRIDFVTLLLVLHNMLVEQTEPTPNDRAKSLTRQARLAWSLRTWLEAQYWAIGKKRRSQNKLCIETGKAILKALGSDEKPVKNPLSGDRPAELRDRFSEFSGSTVSRKLCERTPHNTTGNNPPITTPTARNEE